MGGRGASSQGGLFARFGEIPKGERSINWLALSNDFLDRYQYLLKEGDEGVKEFYSMIPEYAYESGVSAWKLGRDGYPEVDNLQGLMTLANYANSNAALNILKGNIVGSGNDGEPTLKNVKVEKQSKLSKEELKNHVYNQLSKNYESQEGKFDIKEAKDLYIYHGNGKDPEVSYGGVTFTNPKKGFDTQTGLKKSKIQEIEKAKSSQKSTKSLYEKAKESQPTYASKADYLKAQGFKLEPFTSKKGKKGYKYVEDGVVKTVMESDKYYS